MRPRVTAQNPAFVVRSHKPPGATSAEGLASDERTVTTAQGGGSCGPPPEGLEPRRGRRGQWRERGRPSAPMKRRARAGSGRGSDRAEHVQAPVFQSLEIRVPPPPQKWRIFGLFGIVTDYQRSDIGAYTLPMLGGSFLDLLPCSFRHYELELVIVLSVPTVLDLRASVGFPFHSVLPPSLAILCLQTRDTCLRSPVRRRWASSLWIAAWIHAACPSGARP